MLRKPYLSVRSKKHYWTSNQSIMYMDKKNEKRGSYVKIVDPIVTESSFITLLNTYSLVRKLSTKTSILED